MLGTSPFLFPENGRKAIYGKAFGNAHMLSDPVFCNDYKPVSAQNPRTVRSTFCNVNYKVIVNIVFNTLKKVR